MKSERVDHIVSWRLCLGCGACAVACPQDAISLADIEGQGIRPFIDNTKCKRCAECVKACPGIGISQPEFTGETIPELRKSWGPVLEVWEGHASDPEIRFKGSSGGAATALALYCLEKEDMGGVLHIGASADEPLRNVAFLSENREDLVKRTGSRYSPAAPCEKLDLIMKAESPCVFIGKPCDVAALRKLQGLSIKLRDKAGLAISIFCAGTPSTNGTLALVGALRAEPGEVGAVRYRGCGWPGTAMIELGTPCREVREMSYEQSWGDILSRHTQFRCRLCPDGTGELADISCGDPWYRKADPGEAGSSLVLVRTEAGRTILHRALDDSYVLLRKISPTLLPKAQTSLLKKRQSLYGRLLALRMLAVPAPKFEGFQLAGNWMALRASVRFRSFFGTVRRAITRGWLRKQQVCSTPEEAISGHGRGKGRKGEGVSSCKA